MKPELSLIKEIFDSHFMNWNIFLDPEAIRDRRRGKILEAGWTIWFLFGINEKGEYLDYY